MRSRFWARASAQKIAAIAKIKNMYRPGEYFIKLTRQTIAHPVPNSKRFISMRDYALDKQ